MSDELRACKNCMFCHTYEELVSVGGLTQERFELKKFWECRRRSPQLIEVSGELDNTWSLTGFPYVHELDWCGEFLPNEN